METTELILLYDYYGELLTERQRECFELRYYQDFSLGEIGQELGISRQGVYDNLSRTEALLKKMEDKTGCVRRDMACRKAAKRSGSWPSCWSGMMIPKYPTLPGRSLPRYRAWRSNQWHLKD